MSGTSGQGRISGGVPAGGQFAASTRSEAGVSLAPVVAEPRRDGGPIHDANGNPMCHWCPSPATSWEALLRSSGGEYPRNYRCDEHRRTAIATGYVSGNITDADRVAPAPTDHHHAEPAPSPDQSYCDIGRCQQCSGYTEDESDPESCMHDCHELTYKHGA